MIMVLAGPGTKNDCAAEGQQQFTRNPIQVVRQKNMVMGPVGPGAKNDYTGEDQEQITSPHQIGAGWIGEFLEGSVRYVI
jgi:hypothetical protein